MSFHYSVIHVDDVNSRILYALPVWGEFLSVEPCKKINVLFRLLSYFSLTIIVSELLQNADRGLFYNMLPKAFLSFSFSFSFVVAPAPFACQR